MSQSTEEPPDPRNLLANERTFLAWIRTALALLAAAAAVTAVDLPMSPAWQRAMSAVLATIAILTCLGGWASYRRRDSALHERAALPPLHGEAVLVFGLVVVGVVLIVLTLA